MFGLKGILSLDTSGFVGSIRNAADGVKGLKETSANASKSIQGIVASAAGFIGLGMGIKSTFDTFVTFEKKMSNVQALSGGSAKEMEALSEKAMEMGQLLPASSSDAADAMANLSSAGFSVDEVMQSIEGTLFLAASAQTDMATAADITSGTLRGFGLAAADANHVADVLAKTSADTNAGIIDLGEAMKYIAPVAKASGISLEETASAIGIMANANIKGSQAGTTLRGALIRLTDPSKQARLAMEGIGFSAFDNQGKMKNLGTIIGELQSKTSGLTDEQRNATISTIFGTEALSGMLALMQSGQGNINQLTGALKNADGASKQMAETQTNNVYGALENIKGAFENLQIKIVKEGSPAITGALNGFADAMPAIAQGILGLTEFVINNKDALIALAIAYKGYQFGLVLTTALERAQAIAIGAKTFILRASGIAMFAYTQIMAGARIGTTLWTAAQLLLNGAMTANPIGLVIIGVTGLIYIVKKAYERFEGFRDMVDSAWQSLKNFFGLAGKSPNEKLPAGVGVPKNANGTSYFTGGVSQVNERGGEMQVLPSGTSILPADRTKELVEGKSGGNNITINIDAKGMDVDELVAALRLRLANI